MRKKIAFLDRDGVINKKQSEGDYVTAVHRFEFNSGIFELLRKLSGKGFEFIIITNQRGIARGFYSEADLKNIHDHMQTEFKKQGIDLLDIFYCPHEEGQCSCRKPKPGLLEQAARKYDINLAESILISDSRKDVEMGEKFGIGKNIFVETDKLEPLFSQFGE